MRTIIIKNALYVYYLYGNFRTNCTLYWYDFSRKKIYIYFYQRHMKNCLGVPNPREVNYFPGSCFLLNLNGVSFHSDAVSWIVRSWAPSSFEYVYRQKKGTKSAVPWSTICIRSNQKLVQTMVRSDNDDTRDIAACRGYQRNSNFPLKWWIYIQRIPGFEWYLLWSKNTWMVCQFPRFRNKYYLKTARSC